MPRRHLLYALPGAEFPGRRRSGAWPLVAKVNGRAADGGEDPEEDITYVLTQLADFRHADRLRGAGRARAAATAIASAGSARRTRARAAAATPAGRMARAIFVRLAA
jgi:hypothetical protein